MQKVLYISRTNQQNNISMTTEKTYWNQKGRYQEVYDKIFAEFIPSHGEAKNHHAEAVRCISRIYYDFFNNGFCNAIDEDRDWTEYYEKLIYNVYEYLEYNTLETVESNATLKSYNDSKIEMQLEKLTDEVLQKAKRWLDGFNNNYRYLFQNIYEEIEKILNETGAHERFRELAEMWELDYEELGVDFESAIWECMQDRIHKR